MKLLTSWLGAQALKPESDEEWEYLKTRAGVELFENPNDLKWGVAQFHPKTSESSSKENHETGRHQ